LASVKEIALDGARLRANLQDESHLVGARAFRSPQELAAFLKTCGLAHAKATSELNRRDAYTASCEAFQLKGMDIGSDDLPNGLLRYSTSRNMAATLAERILGKMARRDFDSGVMSVEDAFNRIARFWSVSKLTDGDALGRSSAVFATFDMGGTVPRDDARAMADALALPVLLRLSGPDQILFVFSYTRDAVHGIRFPTVADAGLFHLFQPADEVLPDPSVPQTLWGWTRPLRGQQAQPEIVHANAPLQVLDRPPTFVGRISL
jgi:hypothetical protein